MVSEERAALSLNKVSDRFLENMALLKAKKAPESLVGAEIERRARVQARIALRTNHYTEYRAIRDHFMKGTRCSPAAARMNADMELASRHAEEYQKLVKSCKDSVKASIPS
jgi:hypothetical protein